MENIAIDKEEKGFDANGNKIETDENDITFRVIEVLENQKTRARQQEFNHENIHLLAEVSNYEKEYLEKIAFKIKDEYAEFVPNNCNIDLWDNKEAYKLYLKQQVYYKQFMDELLQEFRRTRVPFGDKHQKLKEEWDKKTTH